MDRVESAGDCFDNASMESFWARCEIELFNRRHWRTNLQLAVGIADYIESFYNVARRHCALDYLTPIEFEHLHSTHIQQAVCQKACPPDGGKAYEHPQPDSNRCCRRERAVS